ncbi:MAG: hypothetical protein Q7J57_05315, partial [Gemmobacter sp.]|nr:hypothetical protein [Gemmobacter sp.]
MTAFMIRSLAVLVLLTGLAEGRAPQESPRPMARPVQAAAAMPDLVAVPQDVAQPGLTPQEIPDLSLIHPRLRPGIPEQFPAPVPDQAAPDPSMPRPGLGLVRPRVRPVVMVSPEPALQPTARGVPQTA